MDNCVYCGKLVTSGIVHPHGQVQHPTCDQRDKRIAELETALRPFADRALALGTDHEDDGPHADYIEALRVLQEK